MNTLRFSPARRMFTPSYFGAFPSFFEDAFNGKDFAQHVPSVNILETENGWNLEVSAPGFAKEDFKVSLEKDVLTISGEHKTGDAKNEKNYTRREFSYGSFSRTFRVKENSVDVNKVTAAYENGILNISLPKAVAEPKQSVNINIV